jgi:hypothetical protein
MTFYVCVVGEDEQRQVQPQVLRLRCSQRAVSSFAQDDKVLSLEEEQATTKAETTATVKAKATATAKAEATAQQR